MDWLFQSAINTLQSELTLSSGLAVIVFTLVIRLILMPISFASLKQTFSNMQKLAELKPEIEVLKEKYSKDPVLQSQKLMELYKSNGVSLMSKNTVLNMMVQAVVGIGMFQGLSNIALSGRLAWIADISKSDIFLSVAVAFITGLSMYFMPSAADSVNYAMIALMSVVCLISLLNVSSAIGLYWGTSSVISLFQSLAAKLLFENKRPLVL
ncbi:YidC/Oxa1 family membrane protein insertase [Parashewanella tropica]|uniref:YidC/Oxa1 family membrane protein insertase n=1 Tax=Parashewanella tropica TaxID=2547970 RepID=UPI0010594302|nr:membrane protein insertase YidC [Parashewanella tropica]